MGIRENSGRTSRPSSDIALPKNEEKRNRELRRRLAWFNFQEQRKSNRVGRYVILSTIPLIFMIAAGIFMVAYLEAGNPRGYLKTVLFLPPTAVIFYVWRRAIAMMSPSSRDVANHRHVSLRTNASLRALVCSLRTARNRKFDENGDSELDLTNTDDSD